MPSLEKIVLEPGRLALIEHLAQNGGRDSFVAVAKAGIFKNAGGLHRAAKILEAAEIIRLERSPPGVRRKTILVLLKEHPALMRCKRALDAATKELIA
jgi:hypothetical protein